MKQLMNELGLDSTRQLPHVRISSNRADIGHSSAALQLFYSQLTKSQVSQLLISCSPAVLLTAYQVSGISATYKLLTSCSTHSSPYPRYLSYLSASQQLFYSQLPRSQPALISCSTLPKMPKIWNKYSQKSNIGASVPISTFMCLWANYIFPRWVCLFCWRKYVDRSWEYINRSQTHECGNWGWGRAIPRKGIYKRNCLCSVHPYQPLKLLYL